MKQLAVVVLLLLWQGAMAADEARLEPVSGEAFLPGSGDSFAHYIEENVRRINAALELVYAGSAAPFTGGYTQETVAAMRAPYEIAPSADCEGPAVGFLLIHGLTDSPYMLKPVAASLAQQYPCALLRGLLLPGHGTIPGDTLEMQHEQWQAVTAFGVESFRAEVEKLYLVGFSTGSSLSIDYVATHRDDPLIAGLLMLSPALRASTGAAALTPYLRWVRSWLSVQPDQDAAKYESFSVNAAAEFYELTADMDDIAALDIPVFMALSGDDTTIDAAAALNFFCDRTPAQTRRMLWYQARLTGSTPPRDCAGLLPIEAENPDYRYVTYAHTSTTMPPDDSHYGFDAIYRNCVHYSDEDSRRQCQQDDARTVYGEHNAMGEEELEGKLLRRATFNPRYTQMIAEMVCFIEQRCAAD